MSFEGWSLRVRLDEETLKQFAILTVGQCFSAGTAEDLKKKVYEGLSTRLVFEKKESEITAIFPGLAAGLALVAAVLSLAWLNRIL